MEKKIWKKGIFIVNPKAMHWGIGIVTEDQRSEQVKAFFEHECNIKTLGLKYIQPEEITEPGPAKLFLENILVDEEVASKSDRQPFPAILKQFLENFPDGLKGKMLKHYEINYKRDAHNYCVEELDKKSLKESLDQEDYDTLATKIKRLYSKTNLLASFEMMDLNDAFKKDKAKKELSHAFYHLLYGDAPLQKRFNDTVKIFESYKMDKWTTISYPLFIRFPKEYLFVKPSMTKEAAENRGFDIQYSSKVNWSTYKRILDFGEDLFVRLSQSDNEMLHPKDMIDVQTFMWCTYAKGWNKNEIAKAKRELGIG